MKSRPLRGSSNSTPRKRDGEGERLRSVRARSYRDLGLFGLLAALVLVPMLWHILDEALLDIVVYVRPGHICCIRRVEHLRAAGYRVHVNSKQDLPRVREGYEVPAEVAACHTAVTVNGPGYVLEGHVPAQAIARLLAERPLIRGLAVPGMPLGAPGLESAGAGRYDVLAFAHHGQQVSLFEHRQSEPAPPGTRD